MAEDRGFLEKLLKPTEEEKEDVKKKLEKAFETQRGIEKYGYGEFLEKIVEDQKVREGKSPEEIIETKDKTKEYVRGLSQSEAAELIQGADLKGTRKPEKILPEAHTPVRSTPCITGRSLSADTSLSSNEPV